LGEVEFNDPLSKVMHMNKLLAALVATLFAAGAYAADPKKDEKKADAAKPAASAAKAEAAKPATPAAPAAKKEEPKK
jgi:hypothetical protein